MTEWVYASWSQILWRIVLAEVLQEPRNTSYKTSQRLYPSHLKHPMSMHPSIHPSVHPSICLYLYTWLEQTCKQIHTTISVYIYISTTISLSIYIYTCMYIYIHKGQRDKKTLKSLVNLFMSEPCGASYSEKPKSYKPSDPTQGEPSHPNKASRPQ